MRLTRRQRMAISQSEIRKRCKLLGPITQGFRAFQSGIPRDDNPYSGKAENKVYLQNSWAWSQGWDLAQDRQKEKENDDIGNDTPTT